MDIAGILNIALPIALIVLVIGAIWLIVELALTARRSRDVISSANNAIKPVTDNVNELLEAAKPAVEKLDPLVEHVTLTVDAVNVEIMHLDTILSDAENVTGTVSGAVDTIATAPAKIADVVSRGLTDLPAKSKEKAFKVAKSAKDRVVHRVHPQADESPKTYTMLDEDEAPKTYTTLDEDKAFKTHVTLDSEVPESAKQDTCKAAEQIAQEAIEEAKAQSAAAKSQRVTCEDRIARASHVKTDLN